MGTIISFASIVVVAGFFLGCSADRRYKTLSFFFDGVPNPNAEVLDDGTASASDLRASVKRGVQSYHEPYRKMQCIQCHDTTSAQTKTEQKGMLQNATANGLCQKCHKTIPDEVRYIHAPALVNDCLQCHHHHQSPYRKLLLLGGDDLCYRCHQQSDLSEGEHHAEPLNASDPRGTTCTKCHNPHHGRARYFLLSKEEALKAKEDERRNETGKDSEPPLRDAKKKL